MIIERTTEVEVPEDAAQQRAIAYMTDRGFRMIGEMPFLTFRRSNKFATGFVFSPKSWGMRVNMRTVEEDGRLKITVTLDIPTFGNIVSAKDRAFWTLEIDGLFSAIRGQTESPQAIQRIDREAVVLKYLWLLGALVMGGVLLAPTYIIFGLDAFAAVGAIYVLVMFLAGVLDWIKNSRAYGWGMMMAGVLGAVFVLGFFYLRSLNVMPELEIPNPDMPSPNAYDTLIEAAAAIPDDRRLLHITGDEVPDPAEVRSVLQENEDALRIVREGLRQEYRNPLVRSFYASRDPVYDIDGLVQLLVLEGKANVYDGDMPGAMDAYLDAIQLALDLQRGGSLLHHMVGEINQRIARYALWDTIRGLDAETARQAAGRLEGLMEGRVPFHELVQEEKWATLASYLDLFEDPDWHDFVMQDVASVKGLDSVHLKARLILTSNRKALRDCAEFFDEWLEAAKHPYASRTSLPEPPTDPLSERVLKYVRIEHRAFSYTRSEVQNGLLLTTLALRAFRIDEGLYPDSLYDLVPRYLARIPSDPFGISGPLRYKLNGDEYVLYSVGPDGVDDGGRPTGRPGRIVVVEGETGDIVAGIHK